MKKWLLAFATFLALCEVSSSCKKTNNNKVTPIDSVIVPYPDYLALKQGNYWIYQQFEIDDTVVTAQPYFDSCYVGADTTMNGNVYHRWFAPVTGTIGSTNDVAQAFIRDSGAYVVTSGGGVVFSPTDFTTIFSTRTLYPSASHSDTETVTMQMGYKDSVVTVPAGTFTTSTMRQVFHFQPPYTTYGQTRDYDKMYAANIGLVKSTIAIYFTSPQIYEWRLVRYHVQ